MTEYVEIAFPPPDSEWVPVGVGVEFLWGTPLGQGRFQIHTLPAFAEGVGVGDTVVASEESGELTFVDLSTAAVNRFLVGEADLSRKKRAAAVDRAAAAWMLQSALDASRAAG